MKFDVYGRFELEVGQEHGTWVAYRAGSGKRVREEALVFPSPIEVDEIARIIDDMFHELACLDQHVRFLPRLVVSLRFMSL
jgi:hypothetical protein